LEDYVPIIRRNNCVYATPGTCYSVWLTVWYAGWNDIPPCLLDSHPHIVVSPDDGHIVVSPDDGHIVVSPDNGNIVVSPDDGNIVVSPDDGHIVVSPDDGHIVARNM
jgi:DNA-binding beta-propeller fold protein YncE